MTPRGRARLSFLLLLTLALAVAAGSLFVGLGDLSDPRHSGTFLTLRVSRLGAAFVAGAALAAGGVVVQGLFKNPLADPSILGTTAGASLGGKLSLILFDLLMGTAMGAHLSAEMLLPLGCVAGALAALALLMTFHRRSASLLVLLLTGFLLNSLLTNLGSFLGTISMERPELVRALTMFGLGDLSGVSLRRVALTLPLLGAGFAAAMLWSRSLDLMLAGEEEASALGVDVGEVRWACILWTAVLTAAAVSVGGGVGFVGLVVPHALRPLIGAQHRLLLPASALCGGAFVIACDMLARLAPFGSEIPLGVVTGLIGAPLFLVLLVQTQTEAGRV